MLARPARRATLPGKRSPPTTRMSGDWRKRLTMLVGTWTVSTPQLPVVILLTLKRSPLRLQPIMYKYLIESSTTTSQEPTQNTLEIKSPLTATVLQFQPSPPSPLHPLSSPPSPLHLQPSPRNATRRGVPANAPIASNSAINAVHALGYLAWIAIWWGMCQDIALIWLRTAHDGGVRQRGGITRKRELRGDGRDCYRYQRYQVRFVRLCFGQRDSDYVACRGKENSLVW